MNLFNIFKRKRKKRRVFSKPKTIDGVTFKYIKLFRPGTNDIYIIHTKYDNDITGLLEDQGKYNYNKDRIIIGYEHKTYTSIRANDIIIFTLVVNKSRHMEVVSTNVVRKKGKSYYCGRVRNGRCLGSMAETTLKHKDEKLILEFLGLYWGSLSSDIHGVESIFVNIPIEKEFHLANIHKALNVSKWFMLPHKTPGLGELT